MADDKPQETETAPPMHLFEATGIALFRGVGHSKINHPQQGETKRSFRLARLLICLVLAIVSLIIVFGFMHKAPAGHSGLKHLGALIFLIFAGRCFYVTFMLWRKLQ